MIEVDKCTSTLPLVFRKATNFRRFFIFKTYFAEGITPTTDSVKSYIVKRNKFLV
jgi:hypothetical protein